ncbi:MAG: DMT family transporter, partial [Firmicutes bacterium]|nr:DMT family transporter [Bacillota bacterium]
MAKQGGNRMLQGYLAISLCMVGLSFSPLFYKLGFLTGLNALWLNVLRIFLTVVILAGIAFSNPKYRKEILGVSRRSFWISALGGTLLAFHLNGWALSLVYTDAFAASTILGIYVLLTVLFAALILKEKTTKGALSGLFVATAGVVICNLGGGFGQLSGNMLALFAAVTEALYILCGRKARRDMSTIAYTMILYAFTLFWMIVMALFTG